jgi:rhomboid protease GluP
MDLNYILIWMTGISCSVSLARVLRNPSQTHRAWIIVFATVLFVLGAGLVYFPTTAGYVAGAEWVALVLTPLFGARLVMWYSLRQQYTRAWRLAAVLRCLHPFDENWNRARLLHAVALAQKGRHAHAENILKQLSEHGGSTGRAAIAQLHRLTGRWEELSDWMSGSVGTTTLAHDPSLLLLYVRALGESGDLERMLWAYSQLGGVWERDHQHASHNLCRMFVLAFCGRITAVQKLTTGQLSWLPAGTREFWIATAEAASGETDAARQRLHRALTTETDALTRAGIERRLTVPVKLVAEAPPLFGLDALECDDTATQSVPGWRTAYVTLSLIGVNIALFGAETFMGGSENETTLATLGALSAEAVANGEYWRMLAAMFLHCGPLHLFMNMMGLFLLGPFVEETMGRWKYTVAYFGSGLFSMGFVVMMARWHWIQDDLLVGASGSIMGLIGATAIVLLRNWRADRSRVALQRLQRVALAIGLQVVFDLVTPQVSMAAHTSGVLAGAALTFLLALRE